MKNRIFRFFNIALLFSALSFSAHANKCIDEIDHHVILGFYLDLDECVLKDSDIPTVVSFLNAHPEVDSLALGNNRELTDDATILISKVSTITRELYLSNDNVTDIGAEALGKNSVVKELSLYTEAGSSNKITSKGAAALAENSHLETLWISNHNIGDKGAQAFGHAANLKNLLADNNNIGGEGAIGLTNHKFNYLYLINNHIGDLGAMALAKSDLRQIDLSNNPIGTLGVKALAKSTSLRGLALTHVTHDGILALAKNSFIDNLIITYSKMTDADAKLFVKWPSDPGKFGGSLDFSHNRIGDDGATAIASNADLYQVNIGYNEIRNDGAFKFAKNTSLQVLGISYNHIGPAGIEALLTSSFRDGVDVTGNDGNNNMIRRQSKPSYPVEKESLWSFMRDRNYGLRPLLKK